MLHFSLVLCIALMIQILLLFPCLTCLLSVLTCTEECRDLFELLLIINFILILIIASCCFNSLQIK